MSISPTFPKWRWDGRRELAAVLVAEDALADEEIAARAGITRRQLTNWRAVPDFKDRVTENIAEIRASSLRLPIAKKHYRVGVLDTLHSKLLTVVDERAAEYAQAGEDEALAAAHRHFGVDVPAGGGTGLVVKQFKQIGAGRDARLVTEYAVDTGLVREITNLHARAAKELGQEDEAPTTGRVDVRLYIGIDVEAV